MAQRVRALRVGPALADLALGPVISERRRDQVDGYLAFAQESGLRIVAQGRIERGRSEGWFVCPSLLTPSGDAAATLHDDLIGPVQMVLPFDDEAQALVLAHATPHAGAAGLWTRDGARQQRLAQALQVAQVSVNDGLSAVGVELPLGSSGSALALDAIDAHTTLRTVALAYG
jgi:aldehyde dehydrogenase (NAD+)